MMSNDPDVLIIAASETNSNLYYATRFLAPDPTDLIGCHVT